MKKIFIYSMLLVGIVSFNSCEKEATNNLMDYSLPSKLAYTDATFTVPDLNNQDVSSGKPVENDTLTLNYYGYELLKLYSLENETDTTVIKVGNARNPNYKFDASTGEITLMKGKVKDTGNYYADVKSKSSSGSVTFEQAWKFVITD